MIQSTIFMYPEQNYIATLREIDCEKGKMVFIFKGNKIKIIRRNTEMIHSERFPLKM